MLYVSNVTLIIIRYKEQDVVSAEMSSREYLLFPDLWRGEVRGFGKAKSAHFYIFAGTSGQNPNSAKANYWY